MSTSLARRLIGRNSHADAVILMYHRVDTTEVDPWRLAVHPDHFAEHLEVICAGFQPVSLERFARELATGRISPRSIVVTFDDGYRDNVINAQPLLEKHGVPATLFVATGYLDSGRDFWWEELSAVCSQGGLDARVEWERLRGLGRGRRESELDDLWRSLGVNAAPGPSHTLSSEVIAELADGGVFEIGAHTSTHPSLPTIPLEAQVEEIRSSKAILEALVGRSVSSFSYPHGDYTRATVQAVRADGFATACTTSGEPLTRRSRPLELPRMHVVDWTGAELEEQLTRRFGSR
jgi:peptidoglycan/xylan/chitin deacetylase (PgdA/CDA1 family)